MMLPSASVSAARPPDSGRRPLTAPPGGRLDLITPDDAVGVSLLRPHAGWHSSGSFSIEGLDPGRYLVKVHPILIPGAHQILLPEATLEFPETTLLGARWRCAPEAGAGRSRSTCDPQEN